MTPYSALTKQANKGMCYSILFSQLGAFFSILEFFQDLTRGIFRQFCVFAFGAKWNGAMLVSVKRIGQPSVISQIAKHIVRWISIGMTAFHAFWTWANESKQYKPMDSKILGLLVFGKTHLFSSKCSIALANNLSKKRLSQFSVFRKPHSVKASNFSKVGYFVKTLVIGHGLPDFFHVVAPSNAPKCKIHGSQWSDWFSGANLAMKLHYNKTLG
jgi:hypothetical protein